MSPTRNKIISASRRTDIPGWYTSWFLDRIRLGYFIIKNPYNKVAQRIDAHPDNIHSIVFWSKNFAPFIDLQADRILTDMGYNLYFNFTINSQAPLLEPKLPDIAQRLHQASLLCERFGPDKISWRFDPICFYRTNNKKLENTLNDFTMIADALAGMGITRCVTSFYNRYKKVETRISHLSSRSKPLITFVDPTIKDKQKVIRRMADYLEEKNIILHLCCEASFLNSLGDNHKIKKNACIDGKLLKHLYGGTPETKRDYGQRSKQGCQCTKAIDIGSYEDHPCSHNCLFCYANTGIDTQIRQGKRQ
ncbi:MAG: DUF1848 domain-containing protein [Desulfobacteraceae bacterium]|nr:DUF1848 domain-containing protein [Desulfobacteraceae bacterium]